jgi:hypothetical protein
MGIKFNCPNGHKLNVKSFLAGRRGICPECEARFRIPRESGGVAELIIKGDRSGDETRLTDAMQDEVPLGSPYLSEGVSPAAVQVAGAALSYSTTVDPIAESPHAVWYVRPRSGGQYGPAAGEIMREWISEGRVAGDSLVWCEGWPDWRAASSVFPQLAGAGSLPAYNLGNTIKPSGAIPVGNPLAMEGFNAAATTVPGGQAPGGAPIGGGTMSGGLATIAASPTLGPLANRPELRRKSGNFTAVLVIVLVLIAMVLIGVFAWVLVG